ncbi:helix-turn-helix domain-containing protein, partial [Streptomyces sp. NRRL S-646]|uniref:helix-turn-helix domain-containing protein n=1 Tax=Streptomyces sp. NRRL S-646 TaxID=1463917 RepID=UPI003B63484E
MVRWGDVAKPLVVGVVISLNTPTAGGRSPWRKLSCFKQALLTLAHLRKNETFAQVGAGFGVPEATAWRYVDETIEVLAAWAPGLH